MSTAATASLGTGPPAWPSGLRSATAPRGTGFSPPPPLPPRQISALAPLPEQPNGMIGPGPLPRIPAVVLRDSVSDRQSSGMMGHSRRPSADSFPSRPKVSYNFTSARFATETDFGAPGRPSMLVNTHRGPHAGHFRGSSLTIEEMSGGVTVPAPAPTTQSAGASPVLQASPASFAPGDAPWTRARGLSNATNRSNPSTGPLPTSANHIIYSPPTTQQDRDEISRLRRKWDEQQERKMAQVSLTQRISESIGHSLSRVRSRCSFSGSQSDSPSVGRSRTGSTAQNSGPSTGFGIGAGVGELPAGPYDWQAPPVPADTPTSWVDTSTPAAETGRRRPFHMATSAGRRPKPVVYGEPRRKFKFSRAGFKRLWLQFITWFRTRLMRMGNRIRRKRT